MTQASSTDTIQKATSVGASSAAEQRRIIGPAIAMNSVDVVVALASTGLPVRARYLAAATSAVFAGLGAYALRNGDK